MTFSIKDYGLTAKELEMRYERSGQHPIYTLKEWREEVMAGDTLSGYWDWVVSRLEFEQDELDRDNPYTQYEQQETPEA